MKWSTSTVVVILFVITCLAGLGLGTSISSVIDRKIGGVQFKLPDSRFYVVGDKVVGVRDLKIKKNKSKKGIEGFVDAPSTSVPTVTTASLTESATNTTAVAPVPTPSTQTIPPVLPLPQPTGVALSPPAQPVAVILAPSVSDSSVVAAADKASFVDANRKSCNDKDKFSFTAINRNGCRDGERIKYDKNSPEHLRMELELLEMRRAEISNKLDINFNNGHRIGCTSDADCNVINNGSTKNICRVNNTCDCKEGNGPFCQHPANYKDPNTMSDSERQRFKKQNDLSQFTTTDYTNWLLLYKDTPKDLTLDHSRNLQRVLSGDGIKVTDIPRVRASPPPNAPDQYFKLLEGHPQNISFVNSDTAGPYLASNYTSYDQFIPPQDLTNYRVINPDEVYKKSAVDVTVSTQRS